MKSLLPIGSVVLLNGGEKWEVYYSERGRKTTDEFFDTESEALSYIIGRFSEG